jgi:hypothetical protein
VAWLETFASVERLVHGASRGVADEGFYDSTRTFLARVDAPLPIRHVVEFRHGLAAWDFPAAVRAGTALYPSVTANAGLIPPEEYLDGMIAASLAVGDIEGAVRVFATVGPLSGRSTRDFRMLLLASYLQAAITRRTMPPTGVRQPPVPQ